MSQSIQATFIRTAKKPGCEMVKVIIPGRKQEGEWVKCPQNVKNFADKSFQEGDQVVLTADDTMVDGMYNVSRIERPGGAPQQQYTPPQTQQAPPQQQTYTPPVNTGAIGMPKEYMKPKTPEESAQIMRLSVYSSACEAVKALTVQVNPNTICDVIDTIYERGLNRVK